MKHVFYVITKVPRAPCTGGHAGANIIMKHIETNRHFINPVTYDSDKFEIVWLFEPKLCLEVFYEGEIVIIGDNDREYGGGRKPSKWYVEYEEFDNIDDAVKRAEEVQDNGSEKRCCDCKKYTFNPKSDMDDYCSLDGEDKYKYMLSKTCPEFEGKT